MSSVDWITRSAEETIRHGRELGTRLAPPVLILLSGELGAGKTTLTKGLVTGLGAAREEDVTSPTFTLVHNYHNGVRVYHIDLYRVGDFHDFETLGVEDLFAEPAIVIIEWPDKMTIRTDWPVLRIALEHVDESTRRIHISDPSDILPVI
ncbi:MAG: tRNA (adenosine(37)-N6)-threonylcarbamoyltransferase complex ATPase subunit type 1 TsaE [Candidatus Acidiferrales bacterium]